MKPAGDRSAQSGMTLTELVVVSFTLVVLAGLVFTTFRTDSQSFARETSQNATQSALRTWATRMQQSLRGACFNPSGTSPNPYAIVTATDQDFRFTMNATPASAGYRLSGTDLQLWQGGSTWRVVLSGVTLLDFDYFDSQGTQLDPTASTFTASSINEVDVSLAAQPATAGYPGAPLPVIAEHFRIALRNQC